MRRLPVRWRLTLWYTGLIALVMLILGGVVFGSLRWRLYDAFDRNLEQYAEQAVAEVSVVDGMVDASGVTDIPEAYSVEILPDAASPSADGDEGSSEVSTAWSGDVVYTNGVSESGDALRTILTPIRREPSATVVGVIEVSQSREGLDQAIGELGRTLGIMTPIMLILAAGNRGRRRDVPDHR